MSAVAATPAMDRTMPASSNMSWVIIMLASMAYTMAMRRRLRFSGAVRMRRAMAEVRPLPLPRHPTWGENSARIFGRYSGRKFTGELSSRHSLLAGIAAPAFDTIKRPLAGALAPARRRGEPLRPLWRVQGHNLPPGIGWHASARLARAPRAHGGERGEGTPCASRLRPVLC